MNKNKIPTCLLSIILLLNVFAISAQNTGISPTPQHVEFQQGDFIWDNVALQLDTQFGDSAIVRQQFNELTVNQLIAPDNKSTVQRSIILRKVKKLPAECHNAPEGYTIEISQNRILVSATSDAGLFYGWQSVKQLYRYHYRPYFTNNEKVTIPCLKISDYPEYEYRGWMDDISRGPIAKPDFIKRQIRILSEFKLNCLTLYTENTFRSPNFTYAPADAFTPDEIRDLEAYARQYHVELIGNQQCFAHFNKILSVPEYAHLADSRANLNPGTEATYDFLNKLLTEECATYASPWFNINCDETEALGTGLAAPYVQKVGKAQAYSQHILRLHNLLQKKGKRTMMWADIVLKDSTIGNALPKDITMLSWSYAPADHYDNLLAPLQRQGFPFWVVPGTSMWSTIFPEMDSYEKNIANFARDGRKYGAHGILNTCWNDSGEALLNSAWHALCWGAEMAWNPIENQNVEEAEKERATRLAVFDTCFNFHFFHFYNNENIIADFLRAASQYSHSPVGELYQTGSLWRYNPTRFQPGNLTKDILQNVKNERFNISRTIELERLILSEEAQFQNSEIIYCALQAANRMLNETMLRRSQFYLYDDFLQPDLLTETEKENVRHDIADQVYYLQQLRNGYQYLWEQEYRPYWKDTILKKYNAVCEQIAAIPQYVFITTSPQKDSGAELRLRTLFGGFPIHYTLDGTLPNAQSPVYSGPITLKQSCRVQTLTLDSTGLASRSDKNILIHKGLGHCTQVDGTVSSYRPEYGGGGKFALSDGEIGSDDYRDGKWQGYQGQDVTLTYQLNSDNIDNQHIQSITIRYLQNFYDWILAPCDVSVSYIRNGETQITPLKKFHFKVEQVSDNRIGELKIKELNLDCTTLVLTIHNPGPLPVPHGAAGAPSFLFLDEIVIE